jgi:DNA-binding MarR family transcriptional regulator
MYREIEMTKLFGSALPVLPCGCANLRRATRIVTRMYNQELRETGLELTQFTLLMALDLTGEITQGNLGELLALDTTTLTRMLRLMTKRRWIGVKAGEDRRQRLLCLTRSGRQKLQEAWPHWERAQNRLRKSSGEAVWKEIEGLTGRVAGAALMA